MTPLDHAYHEMQNQPEDAARRLAYYRVLASSELFLLLVEEPVGDQITPQIFPVDAGNFVLAFDRADRLSAFAEGAAPFASMSGRKLAEMLNGQGFGLGINLDDTGQGMLLPENGIAWLCETLDNEAQEQTAQPKSFRTPFDADASFLEALDARLATCGGLADCAYLVGVTYENGDNSNLLGFVDAIPEANGALKSAMVEAVSFRATETSLDVAFFEAGAPVIQHLEAAGLKFQLPKAAAAQVNAPPGSNPDRPPILR